MATKSVTVVLDGERYDELKRFAEEKKEDAKRRGRDVVSFDEAASLVMYMGLGRVASLKTYKDKKEQESGGGRKPRAAAAKAPKAAKASAPKAVKKPVGRPKKVVEVVKAKTKVKAAAAPAKKTVAKPAAKKGLIAKKSGNVTRLAPQRPTPPAAPANGTPMPADDAAEVAQA